MRFLAIGFGLMTLAGCIQGIQASCAQAHAGDPAAAQQCVAKEYTRITTGPGSAFAKSQRGD